LTTINNLNLVCQLNKDDFICKQQKMSSINIENNLNELISTSTNDNIENNNKTVILQQNDDSNITIITNNKAFFIYSHGLLF
jgi:ribosomal protein L31E